MDIDTPEIQQRFSPRSRGNEPYSVLSTVPVFTAELSEQYDIREFYVRLDTEANVYYAGSDAGCSCYDYFDAANLSPYSSALEVRAAFSNWLNDKDDFAKTAPRGWGPSDQEKARLMERFNEAVK